MDTTEINAELSKLGLGSVAIVNPKDCKPQSKNARYFPAETFDQLVKNIQADGMESAPFVYEDSDGKYHTVSGHHRVEAAIEAGIDQILVFKKTGLTKDEIVSKQLSHNALVGKDDIDLLKQLFDSIKSIDQKIATGLQDEIDKINYESLNFRVGTFQEFTVMFLPEDAGLTDEAMDLIAEQSLSKPQAEIRLTSMKYWDRFAQAIRKVKKAENIKSNGIALLRLVELANQMMQMPDVDKMDE